MKYTNLQVGRIVAAAMVLTFHAAIYGQHVLNIPSVLGGVTIAYAFRTTIVFLFALSGFILAHCLQNAPLRSFVTYRLLRLFPAYWLAMMIVLAVRILAHAPIEYNSRMFWQAVILWPAGPYRVIYALGIEWTLVYELFLSMAIVPLAALGRRRGLGIGVGVWLAICLGKTLIGGDVVAWFPRKAEIIFSVVNVPFLMGVLVYLTHRSWAKSPMVLVVAAIAFVAGHSFVESANHWSYVLQSIASALAVGYLAVNRQLHAQNLLVRGGDYAYGVYLVHVPILTAFFALIASTGWASQATVLAGGLVALSAGLGYGMFEWNGYRRIRAAMLPKREPDILKFPTAIPARRAA